MVNFTNKIYPTFRMIKYWFNLLNFLIFDNMVPYFCEIVFIPENKNLHAYVKLEFCPLKDIDRTTLFINNAFDDFRVFINVLAHEMIHVYEFHTNKPYALCENRAHHGKIFFKWKKIFETNGLTLRKAYP